jgi:hypothetical protein
MFRRQRLQALALSQMRQRQRHGAAHDGEKLA